MEFMQQIETLPDLPEVQPGRFRRGWNAFKSFWGIAGWTIQAAFWSIVFASVWIWRELVYWFRLFLFTSRRFLRIEVYLALIGAFFFF
jgi:hypothetical protein